MVLVRQCYLACCYGGGGGKGEMSEEYQIRWNADPKLQAYIGELLEKNSDLKEALEDCIEPGCDCDACNQARDVLTAEE